VHDNVNQMKISVEKRVLYEVGDIVTLANCAIAGNAHMNVRESRKAALPHATLLNARDTRHGLNRGENFGDQFRSRLRVENLVDGSSKHPHTVEDGISPQEKSAAHASACAQAGPPITAAEIPTAAANEVSASER